ncbi:MAG TPA: VOC family protein [Treponemataceae bacterium]|nr:VOC family protein [Treponemataceae bacterium]HQL04318.1 VOC family protein [Treponemataceae bacterium]
MKTTPVLNFSGSCAEALGFYGKVFNTKPDFVMHYSDADPSDWSQPLTDAQKNYVYHAEMNIAGQRFMMSDNITLNIVYGNNFFVVITVDTKEEVYAMYDLMKEGSTILVPLHGTTYSSATFNLIDKFGVRWAVMTEQTQR